MNPSESSCEIGARPETTTGSRVLRFRPAATGSAEPNRWEGVPLADYKQAAAHWCGVTRMALIGESGESTAFHVRYFEIAPGGFSSLERHVHEHAVMVLRGRGDVQLGDAVQEVAFGDVVYVAPNEVHQLRNPSATEPFGFLCIVDAQRDRPVTG